MNLEILKVGGSWWNTAWIVLALVVTAYVLIRHGARIRRFIDEVWVELKKCSWPWDPQEEKLSKKYKELIDSTVVVVISTLILAAYVTSTDFVLVKVIGALTR